MNTDNLADVASTVTDAAVSIIIGIASAGGGWVAARIRDKSKLDTARNAAEEAQRKAEKAERDRRQARVDLAGVSMREEDLDILVELGVFFDVLIIEDNHADAFLTRITLENIPIIGRVITVATVDEAAQTIGQYAHRGDPFDLVIADPGLAASDGLDTVRDVLTVAGEIPVMVQTGRDADDIAFGQDCIRAGAKAYFTKDQLHLPDALMRAMLAAMRKSKRRTLTDD